MIHDLKKMVNTCRIAVASPGREPYVAESNKLRWHLQMAPIPHRELAVVGATDLSRRNVCVGVQTIMLIPVVKITQTARQL